MPAAAQAVLTVKITVTLITGVPSELGTDDRLSLEAYGTTNPEADLTHIQTAASDRLNAMQATHCESRANIGGCLERAAKEHSSVRAGDVSQNMIIQCADVNANMEGNAGFTYPGVKSYILERAQLAAVAGVRISCRERWRPC